MSLNQAGKFGDRADVSILRKAGSLVAELGALGACAYTMHRALLRIGGGFYVYNFVAQPVASQALVAKGRGQSILVREVDLKGDWCFGDLPLTPEVVCYRQKQGAVCLCAFKDSEIIGCLWLCIGPYEEDEVRCLMVPAPKGQASWDFDVYVRPEHRLGLAFARLWDAANQYLWQRGVRSSVSRISAANQRSLAAHGRLGALRIGSAMFLRFGDSQLMLSSLWPFVHFSFGPSRIPVIVLSAPRDNVTEAPDGKAEPSQ